MFIGGASNANQNDSFSKRALRGPVVTVVSRNESENSGASDAEGEISSSGPNGSVESANKEMAGGTGSEPDTYYSCVSRRPSHEGSMTGFPESSRSVSGSGG